MPGAYRQRGSAKSEGPLASANVLGLDVLFELPRQRASGVHRLAELLLGDAEALLPICDLVRLVQIDASLVTIVSLLRAVDTAARNVAWSARSSDRDTGGPNTSLERLWPGIASACINLPSTAKPFQRPRPNLAWISSRTPGRRRCRRRVR